MRSRSSWAKMPLLCWLAFGLQACVGSISGGSTEDGAPSSDAGFDATSCDDCNDADVIANSIALPELVFSIDGLFSEEAVRTPVEEGLRYALDRLALHVEILEDATLPLVTIHYSPTNRSYCYGVADESTIYISCPSDHMLGGDWQNAVVNLTLHELGHVVDSHLLAADLSDGCISEGFATWFAGRYWTNLDYQQLGSFRETVRTLLRENRAGTDLSPCRVASDSYYKVYASLFEYVENQPLALEALLGGQRSKEDLAPGWREWLEE